MKLTLYNMPILEALAKMPDESVDCIVTSPPYYGLREYKGAELIWDGKKDCKHDWISYTRNQHSGRGEGESAMFGVRGEDAPDLKIEQNYCSLCGAWRGQLGLEPSFNLYLQHLLQITLELKRVLKPTGTMWWNIGDSYASDGAANRHKGYSDPKNPGGRSGEFDEPTAFPQGIPAKSKMMIPERFAMRLVDEQGWILRSDIIWHKINAMPEPINDRPSKKYEHIYFFSKQKDYFFHLDSMRDHKNFPTQRVKEICAEVYKRAKELRNQNKLLSYGGKAKTENEAMVVATETKATFFRSAAGGLQEFVVASRQVLKLLMEEHPELSEKEVDFLNWYGHNQLGNPEGGNFGDVWAISTKPLTESHYAPFPEELPRRCIKAGCPEGETVLDPFAGSGTALKVALEIGRNAIGCEISSEYCKIIAKRCNLHERTLGEMVGNLEYQLIKQDVVGGDSVVETPEPEPPKPDVSSEG